MTAKAGRVRRLLVRRPIQILLAILVLLIAFRIALPYIVLHVVNEKLAKLDGYYGHVEDVDISLLRGAYRIEGIRIVKTGGRVPVPFFRSDSIDISVEWKALLDGAIVAELVLERPQINFVNAQSNAGDQTGEGQDWRETVRSLVPIKVNRVEVRRGSVHFREYGARPPINLYVTNLWLRVTNLTNSEQLSDTYVARARGRGTAMHSGRVSFSARIDPYAEKPTFDLWFRMRNLRIRELNPFLDEYAGVDAERGRFSLYTELHAREGRFRGYAKPIAEGLQIFDLGGEDEGFFTQAWEALVGLAAEIFENQGTDRLATRIPLSGRLDDPQADVWTTIGQLLKNAFIQALSHGLDRSIPT
jgi:hypothetical protein